MYQGLVLTLQIPRKANAPRCPRHGVGHEMGDTASEPLGDSPPQSARRQRSASGRSSLGDLHSQLHRLQRSSRAQRAVRRDDRLREERQQPVLELRVVPVGGPRQVTPKGPGAECRCHLAKALLRWPVADDRRLVIVRRTASVFSGFPFPPEVPGRGPLVPAVWAIQAGCRGTAGRARRHRWPRQRVPVGAVRVGTVPAEVTTDRAPVHPLVLDWSSTS